MQIQNMKYNQKSKHHQEDGSVLDMQSVAKYERNMKEI